MSEGKSAGFFPSLQRGPYASCEDRGIGVGTGTGSPPSATSTPLSLNSRAAALRLAFFDPWACTTLGKTATAANKTKVTRVPRALSLDIFISLKKLARMGAVDASTVLDPVERLAGKWRRADSVRFLVGIPTKTRSLAMYQSV